MGRMFKVRSNEIFIIVMKFLLIHTFSLFFLGLSVSWITPNGSRILEKILPEIKHFSDVCQEMQSHIRYFKYILPSRKF